MNLPNKITVARLVIAIAMFVILSFISSLHLETQAIWWDVTFILFAIASFTDYLDGYLARKYNMSTTFGRIADPFVDKIVVCGMFIYFITFVPMIQHWMVVIIIGREFLVTGIRGYAESQGVAFPANSWGKAKTVVQLLTIGIILLYLGHFKNSQGTMAIVADWSIFASVWATLVLTIISGSFYLYNAKGLFQGENAI